MKSPVIVIGMHRSGTSLLSRLLAGLGLFIGWELNSHAESVFFLLRNRRLLRSMGTAWDQPASDGPLLPSDKECRALVTYLAKQVSSWSTISYLGPRHYFRWRSLKDVPFSWGWKDPRNTLLLPLWLEVFPMARVVHIVRNGVDVAASLAQREAQRLERRSNWRWLPAFLGTTPPPEGVGWLAWRWSLLQLAIERGRYRSPEREAKGPPIDIESGYRLWTQYLESAEGSARLVQSGLLELRYEDLVADPVPQLRALADYCNLSKRPGRIAAVAASVKRDSVNRFRRDAVATGLFDRVRTDRLMRKWSYDIC